jgi:DNA-damage-inducible protein J
MALDFRGFKDYNVVLEVAMNQTESYVRARIDSSLKEEANAALKAMGLSMSDFIRLALTRVAREKAVPFKVKVPNAKTQTALKEVLARQAAGAEGRVYDTPDALFNELDRGR